MSYSYGAVPVRAIAAVLFMSLLKPCTCPWGLGCRGVTFLCVNPISAANSLRSPELNGGPLSDWTVLNSLSDEDFFIFCRTGLMAGYLEYWSVMTSAYSLLGSGPQK